MVPIDGSGPTGDSGPTGNRSGRRHRCGMAREGRPVLRVPRDRPAPPARWQEGTTVPLYLAVEKRHLIGEQGRRVRIGFVFTLPGRAILTVGSRGPTVMRRFTNAGSGNLRLKLRKPGRYTLQLTFRSSDGQSVSSSMTLKVEPASG